MYFARCRTALQSGTRLLLALEPGSQILWGSAHRYETVWPPPPPTTTTMTGPMNATLPLQVPPLLPDADGQPKTIRSSGDTHSPIPRLEKQPVSRSDTLPTYGCRNAWPRTDRHRLLYHIGCGHHVHHTAAVCIATQCLQLAKVFFGTILQAQIVYSSLGAGRTLRALAPRGARTRGSWCLRTCELTMDVARATASGAC